MSIKSVVASTLLGFLSTKYVHSHGLHFGNHETNDGFFVYTKWLTSNFNGHFAGSVTVDPRGQHGLTIESRYQGTFGITDLKMSETTSWATNNQEPGGVVTDFHHSNSEEVLGLSCREHGGHGIVNLKANIDRMSKHYSNGWLTNNQNGLLHSKNCPIGYSLVGIDVWEQSMYGVVNVRGKCLPIQSRSEPIDSEYVEPKLIERNFNHNERGNYVHTTTQYS
eukprot:Pgem_evm2s8483